MNQISEGKIFVDKEKWRIRFVPWSKSETGVAVTVKGDIPIGKIDENRTLMAARLAPEEMKELALDLAEATVKRFDVEFPNDSKPEMTKVQVLESYRHLMNMGPKTLSYIG